jgi:hypothetical protein
MRRMQPEVPPRRQSRPCGPWPWYSERAGLAGQWPARARASAVSRGGRAGPAGPAGWRGCVTVTLADPGPAGGGPGVARARSPPARPARQRAATASGGHWRRPRDAQLELKLKAAWRVLPGPRPLHWPRRLEEQPAPCRPACQEGAPLTGMPAAPRWQPRRHVAIPGPARRLLPGTLARRTQPRI